MLYDPATLNAPPIQYVRASDNVSIAYCLAGSGEPVVWLPQLFSNIREFWSRTFVQPWAAALSQRYRLVMYDGRNQGSSQRGVTIDSFQDFERDLEAVVDKLGLDRFVLVSTDWFNHVAVRFAVRQPDRVRALVLSSASLRNDSWPRAQFQTLAADDYDAFLRSQIAVGQSIDVRDSMRFLKETISQEDWLAMARAAAASDISDVVGHVTTPALILHARDFFNLPPEESARFAAALPNAQFVAIEGAQGMGHADQGVPAVEAFLGTLGILPAAEEQRNVDDATPSLSARQREVLAHIARGLTNREIATQLVLSERTVERHVADVYARIGVDNRAQAAIFARDHGLI